MGAIPTHYIILPADDGISVQKSQELLNVSCQTNFPFKYLVSSSSPEDDCGEIESDDVRSKKYTQTVSMLQAGRSFDTLVSNPHPDIVQDVLSSKKRKKKTQLSPYQKAVIWDVVS